MCIRDRLKEWVRWAKANNALILFDAAYECFVSEPGLARSIYEVEGAKDCACLLYTSRCV